jgi:4-oxalomesaconate tautomerase
LKWVLWKPTGDVTEVRIRAVNTGTLVSELVQTPGGVVQYDGNAAIDGVPGTAAPIQLRFHEG